MLLQSVAILFFLFLCTFAQNSDDSGAGIWDYGDTTNNEDTGAGIWDYGDTSSTESTMNNKGTTIESRLPEDLSDPTNPEEVCECIPYYLCDSRYTISKRNYGEGLIDTRITKKVECPHYLLKCCDDEDTKELEEEIATEKPEPTTSTTTPKPTTSTTTTSTTTTPKPTDPPKVKSCGYRNFDASVTSTEDTAQFGEYPWVVAIYYHNATNHINYVCSGSLIHPEVVLTAAHCIKQIKKQPRIRAGEWASYHENEKYPHQDRLVSGVSLHARFTPLSLHNDIAILFLQKPVELGPHINVVCLPPPKTVIYNERCVTNGWGRESFGRDGILRKVELPIVPKEQCEQDLANKMKKPFMLHPSFVCAGGEAGKDACKGDGGGPLVCPINGDRNRYFQYGIVSWGLGCGGHRVPGVYVNVPLFRNWIDEKLRRKNLDVSIYEA